ncbi:transcriptional repressor [Sedimentibacter sp. zth1]|uniref:Fur family transcriptional regulator n=1 Tax=Sedimentibacter sp. zth1 TaxID=2816908 RepID=UPI001A920787|nr:transcriptional repressor [Sedimentibacter sp. zth1]QSX05856.1 transcriptional repressor [Sedimentibacter sp. zth1]
MRSNSYNTKSKKIILQYLKSNTENTVTVDDIKEYLDSVENSVNVTTIYRYLNKLFKEHYIMKYTGDLGKKATYRYVGTDSACHEHLHLQCSECGKIIHLNCEYMDKMIQHISNNHDFKIKFENTILFGKCKQCELREKRKNV